MGDDIKQIKMPIWRESSMSWDLSGSMTEATYNWLKNPVPGENDELTGYKGYELTGMLDPDNPDPSSLSPEPPSWRTPDVMMQSAAAWNAASMQEFMFNSGMAPIARGRAKKNGGIGEGVAFGVTIEWEGDKLTVKSSNGDWVLTKYASLIVTPLDLKETDEDGYVPFVVKRRKVDGNDDYLKGWRVKNVKSFYFHVFNYTLR